MHAGSELFIRCFCEERVVSDHVSHAEPTANEPLFDKREIAEFGRDDGEAVSVIGKLLVSIFFYSFVIMSVVGWWTWTVLQKPEIAEHHEHHEVLDD